MTDIYSADRSFYGKLRRRLARLIYTCPARFEALPRPLLTVSFDDAPTSAAQAGAAILEKYGARGTFFISAGLCGSDSHLGAYTTEAEIRALHAAGHEIACHTFSHLDCGRATAAEITQNLDLNAEAFRRMGLPQARTFAYPYGDVSPQAKSVLGPRFAASRALHHGLITPGSDLNQTPAVGIEGADGEQTATDWLIRAEDETAWLVLYTHDVRDAPSAWGCTPEALERLIVRALDMGFEIVTFAEGSRLASGQALQKTKAA
ncbi:MAG: polysaccharide deacetylase family protein [Asticcacaulis sp.]|uniref:polysaccharide deacetylase family protein n=1 Tax=Asticcacaulis sp. TaxID=1872648 RepID=UPI0039E5A086